MTGPSLAPHALLRHDKRRDCWVLLGPERVFVLDEAATAIMRRIDGMTSIDAIATALAAEYDGPPEQIVADIHGLLATLAERGLVRL
jgi:pyrroloquinoline quinone biosynthesis protein D